MEPFPSWPEVEEEIRVKIADDILFLLQEHPEGLDDDQIADLLQLSKRQTANHVARKLAEAGRIRRAHAGGKLRNFALGATSVPIARTTAAPDTAATRDVDGPWHWEGNVQESVALDLRDDGWTVTFTADTASRQRGKGIEATKDARRLWVTVKGYPEGTGTAIHRPGAPLLLPCAVRHSSLPRRGFGS